MSVGTTGGAYEGQERLAAEPEEWTRVVVRADQALVAGLGALGAALYAGRSVRSKIRLGRFERASRARMSTRTVWAKPG